MSRIGKLPVVIPDKVRVAVSGTTVKVDGPLGKLERTFKGVSIASEGNEIRVSPLDLSRNSRALWGLTRSLIDNMVTGVSKGFERVLEINGVGYRAEVDGKATTLTLTLGHSHPIVYALPDRVTAEVDKQTVVKLKSIDKEALGQAAAKIRSFRPPEPYKGKGIKYKEEHIRRKAGKAAK
ncbi:MAG: 50S ribosomal protein L6 [Deltaproteobacteria bacterium]|nr:MAG: 50S ribosomal protein L6 [Deltaproteobacteria bacterium]